MDEELRTYIYQYVLRSPRLSDSPPGVHAKTLPGEVIRKDDDLERSHFSGNFEGSDPVIATTLKNLRRPFAFLK